MQTLTAKNFRFSDFELDGARRLLLNDGKPIPLKAKAFDLLSVLVEHRGEVLSKDELLELVWPGQFVEEGNLKVHISALRKALGERKDDHRFIVTVPGRGYSFVADLDNRTNGEIVVESRRHSHIVVEETFDDTVTEISIDPSPNAISVSGRQAFARRFWLPITGLLLASFGGYFIWQREAGSYTALSAPMQVKRLTTSGKASLAALSPDGKLFAYALGTTGHPMSLWVGHTAGGEPILLRPESDVWYHSLSFAPDGTAVYYLISGSEYPTGALFRVPALGGVPERLRENILTHISFSPDAQQIAYVKNERGVSSLMISDIRGAEIHPIATQTVNSRFLNSTVAWSADGRTIAVAVARDESGDGDCQIVTVNTADGQMETLGKGSFSNVLGLSWHKNGKGLIMSAIEPPQWDSQLFNVSFPEGDVRPLNPDLNGYTETLGASDNGQKVLALQKNTIANIWVTPVNDLASARQVTFGSINSRAGQHGLEWLPNGRILYTTFTDKSQSLWTMRSDGSDQTRLTPDGFLDQQPGVSVDGRTIVFTSNRHGSAEIWRVDADGGNLRQLTTGGHNDMPTISPDGKWIVYVSRRDGLATIWRVSSDGGDPLRLSEQYAAWPRISPDGRFVASVVNTGGKRQLALIPIEGGPPEQFLDVPKTANFSFGLKWSPDGNSLVYRDWVEGYWTQPVAGGAAVRIKGLPNEKLFSFGWSHDAKLFAFSRGIETRDVVLFTNS
jgi:Tol biopolymer transport system component/DNA-binding winged helix-turn-helix (wHTH) protein